MKRFLLIFFVTFICRISFSQQVNGIIVSDTGNVTVVKIWGTHYERGFAYGYLLGDKILSIYNGYIKPMFGTSITSAKAIIAQGTHLKIDSVYQTEAKAVVAGMDSAGFAVGSIDYLDLLVANSFLDFDGLPSFKGLIEKPGCSSLMDWGNATTNTALNGNSVISRHLDWSNNSYVTGNQVVVVHFPSEANEQPWMLIGFAGQISVLSGINKDNVSAFQHMLSDYTGNAQLNMAYEPIWFTLRKGLEKKDYNADGLFNTNDIRDVISQNQNGYASGYIISSLAPASTGYDSLTAMVSEIASQTPFITFRGNEYPDSIPGQNLYTANYEIKRNNHMHFCLRYNAVSNGLEYGELIGSDANWNIMRDSSNAGNGNIQFMQFIPEMHILRLSVHKNGQPAFKNNPINFCITELFTVPAISTTEISPVDFSFNIFPNPAKESVWLGVTANKNVTLQITVTDILGAVVIKRSYQAFSKGYQAISLDSSKLKTGKYLISISDGKSLTTKTLILN